MSRTVYYINILWNWPFKDSKSTKINKILQFGGVSNSKKKNPNQQNLEELWVWIFGNSLKQSGNFIYLIFFVLPSRRENNTSNKLRAQKETKISDSDHCHFLVQFLHSNKSIAFHTDQKPLPFLHNFLAFLKLKFSAYFTSLFHVRGYVLNWAALEHRVLGSVVKHRSPLLRA